MIANRMRRRGKQHFIRSSMRPIKPAPKCRLTCSACFRSAVDHSLGGVRVSIPLHSDLGSGALDLAEVLRCEFNGNGRRVLLQAMQLGCPRNRIPIPVKNKPDFPGDSPSGRDSKVSEARLEIAGYSRPSPLRYFTVPGETFRFIATAR